MIYNTLDAIKHLVWPTRCASCDSLLGAPSQKLCLPCVESLVPASPTAKAECLDKIFSFFAYEGAAQSTIAKWKYHADMAAQKAILDCVESRIGLLTSLIMPNACILPVPPHPKRLRERGFDPVWTFAKRLQQLLASESIELDFRDDVLIRTRHTKPQASLDHEQRLSNLDKAFEIQADVAPHVILVDDVLTTGSTATACATVLRQAGAEHIVLITLACSLSAESETKDSDNPSAAGHEHP